MKLKVASPFTKSLIPCLYVCKLGGKKAERTNLLIFFIWMWALTWFNKKLCDYLSYMPTLKETALVKTE